MKQAFVKPTDGFCFQPKQVTLNILIEQVSSFRVLCLMKVSFKKILKHCTEKHVDDCSVNSVHCMFCLPITYLAFKLTAAVTNTASKQMLTSVLANILTISCG